MTKLTAARRALRPRGSVFASRGWTSVLAAVATALCAGACVQTTHDVADRDSPSAMDGLRSLDLHARSSRVADAEPTAPSPTPSSVAYFGSPNEGAVDPPIVADGAGGYTLDFENTPISAAARAVLGDILNVGYVIDPRAQGTISLSSARPVAKKDVLFAFENALKTNNLMLARDPVGYRIAPAGDGVVGAVDRADSRAGVEAGYGLTVAPLQFVSAPTMLKLMEGFSARPDMVRGDPSGRMLLVVGSGVERQAAVEMIRNFDVDWLRGQSVGVYPVRNSAPETMIAELEKIMDSGEGGIGRDMVKFQAMPGHNAVLAVAARPELLRSAAAWISRLDNAPVGGAGVKVYRLRYGDAKQIAELLTKTFGAASASTDSAASQIAPDSGAATLTAVDRLTGGAKTDTAAAALRTAAEASQTNSPYGGLVAAKFDAAANVSGVRITPDVPNNAILVYANEEMARTVERAIAELDRPKLQVAIDVTIAEVTLTNELTYGVQFYLKGHYGSIGNTTGSDSVVSPTLPGFNFIVGNSVSPQVILSALRQYTDVKILSNPSLVVVDNQTATLEVGDEVPVSTGAASVLSSNNAVVNTIDYKNTGIILRVQPRVNSNGAVLLDIEQEISGVVDSANSSASSSSSGATLTPTISTRKVKSELSVADDQTVLLAGLVSETQNNMRSGLPVLDQIPVLGDAFANNDKTVQRTELVLFIRPQIIRNSADAANVAEELRAKMLGGPFGDRPRFAK